MFAKGKKYAVKFSSILQIPVVLASKGQHPPSL